MTSGNAAGLPRADEPIPLPPSDFASRTLPIREMENLTLFRGHSARRGAIHFNRDRGRWTDPDQHIGTMYLGERPHGAFVEAFNQQIRHTAWGLFINARDLPQFCLCPIAVTGLLRVVDLTEGRHLLGTGADHRICDGPHHVSRAWVSAFQQHPARPDGVIYRSRYAPELFSIAIFESSEASLRDDCSQNILTQPSLLAEILDYFDCALL